METETEKNKKNNKSEQSKKKRKLSEKSVNKYCKMKCMQSEN